MNASQIHKEFSGHIKVTDIPVVVVVDAVYKVKERPSADRKLIRVVESSSLTTDGGDAVNVDRDRLLLASTGDEIVVSKDDLKTIIEIGQGKYQVTQH